MESPWKIGKLRLTEGGRKLLESGLDALARLQSESLQTPTSFFGRFFGFEVSDVRLILVYSNRRPAGESIIVLNQPRNEFLFPGRIQEHFVRLLDLLCLHEPEKAAYLYEIVSCHYGALWKATPPNRIVSEGQAQQLGIQMEPMNLAQHLSHQSLWWQSWGGLLFKFSLETSPGKKSAVSYEFLSRGEGKFRRIPQRELR